MKKSLQLLLLASLLCSLEAQGQAPRYLFLEHFTNSRCGICASRNPGFYNTIDDYPTQVRHVSIHPPVPYSNCVFYQGNTQENAAWAGWYNISGTPRVALNGTLLPAGNPLLPVSTLQNALNQTSSLNIRVEESGSGANRTAKVRTLSVGNVPAGNYKLFAAVVEKKVNLQTPNGEPVHYDVFRDMLPDMDGIVFNPAPQGNFTETNFNFTLNSAWNADEIYVLAFIKNMTTGEVLNTGTKFDPIFTSVQEQAAQSARIWPNPTGDRAFVALPQSEMAEEVIVFDLSGRAVRASFTQSASVLDLDLAPWAPGVYLVKVTGKNGVYQGKLVKQ